MSDKKIFGVTTDGECRFHICTSMSAAIAKDLFYFLHENKGLSESEHKEMLESVVYVGDVYDGID